MKNALLKIVIYGAESTGKTSMAKALAKYYNTAWVPEYARDYLQRKYENCGEICAIEDLLPIAKGQLKLEQKAAEKSKNGVLFCDTNPLQTYYYGKAYYKNFKYPELWQLANQQRYDFYFLTYIDIPWVADDLRDRPNKRMAMHHLFETSLKDNNFPYLTLKGSQEERLQTAVNKVEELKSALPKDH